MLPHSPHCPAEVLFCLWYLSPFRLLPQPRFLPVYSALVTPSSHPLEVGLCVHPCAGRSIRHMIHVLTYFCIKWLVCVGTSPARLLAHWRRQHQYLSGLCPPRVSIVPAYSKCLVFNERKKGMNEQMTGPTRSEFWANHSLNCNLRAPSPFWGQGHSDSAQDTDAP